MYNVFQQLPQEESLILLPAGHHKFQEANGPCLFSFMTWFFPCITLQNAEVDLELLRKGLQQIDGYKTKLAIHFCEEKENFKLEECFEIFRRLCEEIVQCQKVRR